MSHHSLITPDRRAMRLSPKMISTKPATMRDQAVRVSTVDFRASRSSSAEPIAGGLLGLILGDYLALVENPWTH